MLVVAVVVSVSIKITKVKLDNIISYTYYAGYSTLRSVTGQILADFKSTDDDYLDKEAMIMPKTLLSLIMPLQKARAEGKKIYTCATENYDGPYFSSGYAFSVPTSTTPNDLNCETRARRWYTYSSFDEFKDIGRIEITFVKCPGKYKLSADTLKYWDSNTSSFDDTYSFRYTHGDTVVIEATCNNPCGNGMNNCGTSHVAESLGRFSCNGQDFLESGENLYNKWPICVREEIDTPDPDPNVCTTPSEAEQQVHRCQNQEEWKGEPTCGYVPITCPEGNHWSVNSCGCVPESPTLPRKGINFCRKFVSYTNTKSNSPECTGTAISSTETDFSNKTADITLRNGMRIYNMSQNPQEIGILEGNTQGASYDGVPNINTFGYTVYLDIDGEKGSSTLWEDVYKFYITMAGKVIPAYDENNPNEEVGGNSRRHLMTSVEKEAIVDGRRQMRWLKKSVTFKEGACTSNYLGSSSRYCNGVNLLPDCNDPINPCFMKHISPVKFF